jgi:glycerophosphoryl diester phosphodiesterase
VRFEIQAHRANDLLSLRRLLGAGPSSVEIDVGLGPDGLVAAHEADLSDASARALADLLAAADDTPVVLEAKCFPPTTPDAFAFTRALRPLLGCVAVASFDERVIAEVSKLRPSTPTTFLFEEPLRAATSARTLGPRSDLVTRELVECAHAVGVRVVPWTVNDALTMAELIDLGVDGLVTDLPELADVVAAERLHGQRRRAVA